jgi:hypothetical protein
MRKVNVIIITIAAILFAAGPSTRPVNTVDDVETNYRNRVSAAKKAYSDEIAKADAERLAGLQILLSRAVKAKDTNQSIAIQKKIDEITGGNANARATKIVYLCQATGSMLSVFGALKQNLNESIDNLDATQQFNAIFFSDDVSNPLFKDHQTHFASTDNKKLAKDFIFNIFATGRTQPLNAINEAIKEKPDMIYFLTDGLSNMDVAGFDKIADAFRQGDRNGKITVNCIFLESAKDPKLEQRLKQVSEAAHGTFVKVQKSDM